jgi:hypothetical protein
VPVPSVRSDAAVLSESVDERSADAIVPFATPRLVDHSRRDQRIREEAGQCAAGTRRYEHTLRSGWAFLAPGATKTLWPGRTTKPSEADGARRAGQAARPLKADRAASSRQPDRPGRALEALLARGRRAEHRSREAGTSPGREQHAGLRSLRGAEAVDGTRVLCVPREHEHGSRVRGQADRDGERRETDEQRKRPQRRPSHQQTTETKNALAAGFPSKSQVKTLTAAGANPPGATAIDPAGKFTKSRAAVAR